MISPQRFFMLKLFFYVNLTHTQTSTHILLPSTYRSKHCCGYWRVFNLSSCCKYIWKRAYAARVTEINAGISIPSHISPSILHFYLHCFAIFVLYFQTVDCLNISLISIHTSMKPCLQFQQSRLSSLSEAAMAPTNPVQKFVQIHANLRVIILQQFVADMSKTHDFNKEEYWTKCL